MSGALACEALGGMQHWEFYYIYLQHILLREEGGGGTLGKDGTLAGWSIGTFLVFYYHDFNCFSSMRMGIVGRAYSYLHHYI